MIEAEKIINQNNDWITVVFLIILIVLAIQKFYFRNMQLHTSVFFLKKNKLASYFNKEKNIFFNLYQVLSFIVQLASISLLLYFLTDILEVKTTDSNLNLFIKIVFIVSFYFLIRFVIGVFLASIFNLEILHKKVFYEKTNFFNNLVLWMLPFLVFISYSKQVGSLFIKITVTFFILLALIRYALLIINNKKLAFNNLFYFILYLCVLEIAPLVIIIKLTIYAQN